jgi:hypothetical protein
MKTTNIQLINENNLLKKQLNTFTIPVRMQETQMPVTSRSIKDKISNLGDTIGNISARILNDNNNNVINDHAAAYTHRSSLLTANTTGRTALNQLNSVRSIV